MSHVSPATHVRCTHIHACMPRLLHAMRVRSVFSPSIGRSLSRSRTAGIDRARACLRTRDQDRGTRGATSFLLSFGWTSHLALLASSKSLIHYVNGSIVTRFVSHANRAFRKRSSCTIIKDAASIFPTDSYQENYTSLIIESCVDMYVCSGSPFQRCGVLFHFVTGRVCLP